MDPSLLDINVGGISVVAHPSFRQESDLRDHYITVPTNYLFIPITYRHVETFLVMIKNNNGTTTLEEEHDQQREEVIEMYTRHPFLILFLLDRFLIREEIRARVIARINSCIFPVYTARDRKEGIVEVYFYCKRLGYTTQRMLEEEDVGRLLELGERMENIKKRIKVKSLPSILGSNTG